MSVCLSVCLSCLSVYCVRVTFVVFTDCESCTRPIPINPGSMEPGGYGLTRGTCFVARRLEVVAVAGLLWISWCVLGGADFFFLRTHTACCKYEAALPHLTLYWYRKLVVGCGIEPLRKKTKYQTGRKNIRYIWTFCCHLNALLCLCTVVNIR